MIENLKSFHNRCNATKDPLRPNYCKSDKLFAQRLMFPCWNCHVLDIYIFIPVYIIGKLEELFKDDDNVINQKRTKKRHFTVVCEYMVNKHEDEQIPQYHQGEVPIDGNQEKLCDTRVELEPDLDIIVSFQVESQRDVQIQEHIEEEMNHVVEEHEDLQVIKKKDVAYVEKLEKKPKQEATLTEYGSTLSTSFTSTLNDGYNIVRRNTFDKLPPELRSIKRFRKSTNAIVRKTLQIQMDDEDEEEEEEKEEEIKHGNPTEGTENIELKQLESKDSNYPTEQDNDKPSTTKQGSKKKRTERIYINDRAKNKQVRRRWPNNYIRTTKYRWWSFIPQNLFEQFRRIHNIYFLLTIIVQTIPEVSPTIPTSSILPFCIIIILTALKDLYEDLLRYRADRIANNKPCYVLRDGVLQRIPSKDLEVGDIVRVDRDDALCADVVCLSTAREDGACYIDTAQLDGETSLKTRRSVKSTHHMGNDPLQYKAVRGKLTVEAPSANLDRFNGRLSLHMKNEEKHVNSLDMNNLLLRVS